VAARPERSGARTLHAPCDTPGRDPGPARHDQAVAPLPDPLPDPPPASRAAAVANAHAWFEVNSGWAPPDEETLAEWLDDGVCRCPDECLVAPDAWCEHGLASWWLILGALDQG
jgi:hypothetical protein